MNSPDSRLVVAVGPPSLQSFRTASSVSKLLSELLSADDSALLVSRIAFITHSSDSPIQNSPTACQTSKVLLPAGRKVTLRGGATSGGTIWIWLIHMKADMIGK